MPGYKGKIASSIVVHKSNVISPCVALLACACFIRLISTFADRRNTGIAGIDARRSFAPSRVLSRHAAAIGVCSNKIGGVADDRALGVPHPALSV